MLRGEVEQAIKEDEKTRRKLEIERFRHDKKEKERPEAHTHQVELEMERISAGCQRQIDYMKLALQTSTEASEGRLGQISQLTRMRRRNSGRGFFSQITAFPDDWLVLR